MPENLSAALQQTIRKCLSVDKKKRMGLRIALRNDPWLNDDGRLPDLFAANDDSLTADRERTRQRHLKDLEEEKRRPCHVKKSILYHPINPSIYFTSRSMRYTPYSKRDEVVQAQEMLQKHLIKTVRAQLKQANLQPLQANDMQSPLHRFLRKLKNPQRLKKTASTLSLTQLYQRVAKDQITYYAIDGNDEHMLALVCASCELLGITYRHESRLRLICVMTMHSHDHSEGTGSWFHGLKDRKRTAASASTPMLTNQNSEQHTNASFATATDAGQRSSLLSNNSTSTNRWSKTFKRLSMPFSHQQEQLLMPWSQSFQLHSSTNNPSSQPPTTPKIPAPATTPDPEQEKESTVVFTIEAFVAAENVVGLRYSKLEGSAKVFKYAKGWVSGVLAYNTESSNGQ